MRALNIPEIYGIVLGSLFVALCAIQLASYFARWTRLVLSLVKQHLTIPFLVRRHRLFGPWSRCSVLLHLSYIAVNVFLVSFGGGSLSGAGHRAGAISVANMIFLLSFAHLSFLADVLGINLRNCQRIHRVVGWITLVLQVFHVGVATLVTRVNFSIRDPKDFSAILGATSVGILIIFSLAWFRRWTYEVFIRTHQILAGVNVYGILRHLPKESRFPHLCIYIALGTLGLTSLLHVVKMRLTLPRPVKVEAGQYINLWMPSVSLWSWAQTHPFTVTSWSRGRQDTLDLLVQPRRGFSADILRRIKPLSEGSLSFLSFFTGPHGVSERVDNYESILVVASGFGIAAVVPYIRQMIYGYNTCTSQIRRIHLVWQVDSIGIAVAAQKLLNSLLEDDTMDDGYILKISIYIERGQLARRELPFGNNERAFLYQGVPDYWKVVSLETSGDLIERHPNIRDKRGEALVMVSTTDDLRDHLREITREYLGKRVDFIELEYQPSSG
ncbi:putative cell surface metalloreductase [Aspergillus ambiguus]|uniref:ferric reductase family protein n=1 Tax=Aspergillus ambiguus TaxID=176160 RepID=UPI003CCDAC85